MGAPPATLLEVSLHEEAGTGSYDVSVVDGYNLPVAVWSRPANRSGKCFIAGCAKDVNAVCPPELQVVVPGKAKAPTVVACRSACLAFGLDSFCCRGAYGTAEACKGSVYSRLFRDACPDYYSYAYDAAATTARCHAQEYVLNFCPSRWAPQPTPIMWPKFDFICRCMAEFSTFMDRFAPLVSLCMHESKLRKTTTLSLLVRL